jgi:GAF domain-containing protein
MMTGALIAVPDLRAAVEDYPRFAPQALDLGVRSVHAVPLIHQRTHVGSLDIINREPMALDVEQLGIAQLLADVTMSYIANSRMVEEATTTAQHLQRALDSRVAIEQAKGILVERYGITPTEAFERLRHHARSNRIRLLDVAEQVITGDLRL